GYQTGGILQPLRAQKFLGRRKGGGHVTVGFQQACGRFADRQVIIDNRDERVFSQRASRAWDNLSADRQRLGRCKPIHRFRRLQVGRSSCRSWAILIKSASDLAPNLRMALPRCTFTVISVTPSWPAICLFIKPVLTNLITSCSRAVNVLKRALSSATGF